MEAPSRAFPLNIACWRSPACDRSKEKAEKRRKGEKVMKIAMSTILPVLVIDKSKKNWEMNGNKGTVYKAICHKKVEDEVHVEEVRITEEVYNEIEAMHKYHFDCTVDVRNSRLEVYGIHPADSSSDNKCKNAGTTK